MKVLSFGLLLMLATVALPQPAASDTYRGGLVMPPLAKPKFILTDSSGDPFDFLNRKRIP